MISKFMKILKKNKNSDLNTELNWVFGEYLSLYFGGLFLYNYAFINSNSHILQPVFAALVFGFLVFYPMMKKVKKINEKHKDNNVILIAKKEEEEMQSTFKILEKTITDKNKKEELKKYLKV